MRAALLFALAIVACSKDEPKTSITVMAVKIDDATQVTVTVLAK